jgi:hypothetical protein
MKIKIAGFRNKVATLIRPWIAEFVIRGFIPQRVGRYRTLDMLLIWAEDGKNEPGRLF